MERKKKGEQETPLLACVRAVSAGLALIVWGSLLPYNVTHRATFHGSRTLADTFSSLFFVFLHCPRERRREKTNFADIGTCVSLCRIGNNYAITNESETRSAKVFFAQGCCVVDDVVDDDRS